MSKFSTLTYLMTLVASPCFACTGLWTGLIDNTWDTATPANWSNDCTPQAAGDVATFGMIGPTTVQLNFNPTITNLTYNAYSLDFNITETTPQTYEIYFAAASSINPSINVLNGSQTIDVRTTSTDDMTFNLLGNLTLTSNSFFIPTNGINLTLTGTGILTNNNFITSGLNPDSGTITQSGITLVQNSNVSSFGANTMNLNLLSGTIQNNGGNYGFQAQTMTITAGNISNTNNGIFEGSFGDGAENFTINGGTFLNDNSSIGNGNNPNPTTLTINGGTFTNQNNGQIGNSKTSINFNNGSLTNNQAFFAQNAGTLTINGGTIISTNNSNIRPQAAIVTSGQTYFTDQSSFSINSSLTVSGGSLTFNQSNANSQTYIQSGGSVLLDNQSFSNFTTSTISGGSTTISDNSNFSSNDLTMTGGAFSVLNNGSANFNSFLTVNGGTFKNNNFVGFPAASVNSSGIVTGTGFFGNPSTFTNNGTVIPGDAQPGQLSFDTYVQTAQGNLVINIVDQNIYGSINANTAITLNGTLTVEPFNGFTYSPQGAYQIVQIQNNNVIDGKFSKIIDLFPSTVTAHVTYLPQQVVLELFPVFDSFISFKEVGISTINQINLLLVNHMDRMIDPCSCSPCRTQVYIDPIGSVGRVKGSRDLIGYKFDTIGFLAGIDLLFRNGGVGFAFDYERVKSYGLNNFGHFQSNKCHFNGYGTMLVTPLLSLDAIIGGGWDRLSTRRTTGYFANERARGSPHASTFDAFLGAEYLFTSKNSFLTFSNMNLIPLAGLQYIYYKINHFEESGVEGFNFSFDRQNYESLRTLLGLKLNSTFCINGTKIVPQVNVGWQRELEDPDRRLRASGVDFISSPTLLAMPGIGPDIVVAGADIAIFLKDFAIDLSYEFEGCNRYYNHFFYLECSSQF